MTNQEIVRAFTTSLDKIDSYSLPELTLQQKLYFINKAILEEVVRKFTGYNKTGKGFEENSLRETELKNLIVKQNGLTNSSNTQYLPNVTLSVYVLPNDYLFYIRYVKNIRYKYPNCDTYTSYLKPSSKFVQLDDLDKLLDDPFNFPTKENTLDTIVGNTIEIYRDTNSDLQSLSLVYLKKPTVITVVDTTVYTDLPDITLYNAITWAVDEVLEAIESNRLGSHKQEIEKII